MVNDAYGAVAELAASQHGAFSVSQAALLGVTRTMLRGQRDRGFWYRAAPRVLIVAGTPPSWRQRLMVATLSSDHIAVSHRAGATLQALDGARWPLCEVTTWAGGRCFVAGAIVHSTATLDASDVVYVDGIRVTSVARTLVDVGAVCDEREVLRLVDDALRKGMSRRTLEATLARLDRPGPSGTGVLRRVLAQLDDVDSPDSWFERQLLLVLSVPDLPKPVLQHCVRDDRGAVVAELDVAYPALRLGIEGHSKQFHAGLLREQHDIDRHNRCAALGWVLVYISHRQAQNAERLR